MTFTGIVADMYVMSTPSRQKSWQNGRERVSVLAALAVKKETVSRVLAELREQHKPPGSDKPLSQEKAAARVGVTGRQWQRWESGESEPYLRNLEAVASAFNVPVDRFLTMEEQDDDATTSVLSLEEVRTEFREYVRELNAKLDVAQKDRAGLRSEIETQNKNLRTQTQVLGRIVAAEKSIAKSLEDQATMARGLDALLQRLGASGLLAPPEAGEG